MPDSEFPKVSCVMVTADRSRLCKRSILCYKKQTYKNKELIVVDDGSEDLGPLLAELPAHEVRYLKLEKTPENTLGKLRNRALDEASGTFIAQWDDDDWYHPNRIEKQAHILNQGYDACCLPGTLMHIDHQDFFDNPYIGYIKEGVPGTIMHRQDAAIRYPSMRRAEDTIYLKEWLSKRFALLPRDEVHLFIRCFHGSNTWEQKHFLTRIRNTPLDLVAYIKHKYVTRNLLDHPRFKISREAREAFEQYLEDSISCSIFDHERSGRLLESEGEVRRADNV